MADAPQGRGGSWNNDGEIIFAPSHRGGISEVSANGGPVRVLTRLEEARGETSHRWPVFLPDGKRFLYVCGGAGPHRDLTGIYSGSLESPGRRLILSGATNFALISGLLLFTRENYLMAERFNGSTLELVGEPIRIAENLAGNGPFLFSAFATSQNGTIVYLSDPPNKAVLRWLGRDGKESGSLGSSAEYQTIRFSRDGKRLAVTVGMHAPDIWIYDLDRGVRTRFTSNPASDWDALWSPDGKQIAFASDRASFGDVYVKSSDGLTLERLLAKFDNAIDLDDWSPDGRLISVHTLNGKSQRGEIWLVPTDGMQKPYPFIATEFSVYGGRFSPDMRWFTFVSNETGRDELYAIPFPGGGEKRQLSTAGALGHHWTRNGKEIVYGALPGLAMSIAVDGGKFSDPRFLFKVQPTVLGFDTLDGQRFLAIDATTSEPVLMLTTNWTRLLDRNSEH